MDTEQIKSKVRAFLARFFRKYEIQDDEDIFALGFVNSLFAMQLVMFIEKEFSVQVSESELDLNNFRSINAIAYFIQAKAAA